MTMQGVDMRALRKAAGMTQAEFAEAIGMTATSIGLMERGVASIEKRTALAAQGITAVARARTLLEKDAKALRGQGLVEMAEALEDARRSLTESSTDEVTIYRLAFALAQCRARAGKR